VRVERILVPVDFSPHAERALAYAADMARTFGAELHLLHCYQVGLGGVSPYAPVLPQHYGREIEAAAGRRLDEWSEGPAANGLTVHRHLSQRFPPEGIVATATEIRADVIVMGTRGLTGFKHVLLGSVTERTVRTAPCPVITVRGDAEAEE